MREVFGPEGHYLEQIFDSAGNVVEETNSLGHKTTRQYDPLGRLISETFSDPDGAGPLPAPTTRYEYDVNGNLVKRTQIVNPATSPTTDRVTTYEYDTLNRTILETSPPPDATLPARQTRYEYDAAGNVTSVYLVLDPGNPPTTPPTERLTASYVYDGLNRTIQETLADPDQVPGGSDGPLTAPVTQYVYDGAGNRVAVQDPVGSITTWRYDALNRPFEERSPLYNASWTLTEAVNQLANASGASCASDTAVQHVMLTCYDEVGNVTKEISPTGPVAALTSAVTVFQYDAVNRLQQVTDAENGVVQYGYDEVGNRIALQDAVGNITTWLYDGNNRVVEERDPLFNAAHSSWQAAAAALEQASGASCATDTAAAHVTLFCYDTEGRLEKKIDRNARRTTYDHDDLGRPTQENWLDAAGSPQHTLDFTYNEAGLLHTAGDSGSLVTLTYDDLDRLKSDAQNIGSLGFTVTLTSKYDQAGQRSELSAVVSSAVDFVTDYDYDQLDRLTRIEQHTAAGGGAAVAEKRIDIAYDAANRFDTITRYADLAGTQPAVFADYTFDIGHRWTDLNYWQTDAQQTSLAGYSWTFDAANRTDVFTSATDGTAAYTYDETDQLEGADYDYQADELHSYDANGNRTGTGYTLDPGNRMQSDPTYSYVYDGEGNRTKRTETATGAVTEYVWDYRNRLVEIIDRVSDGGAVTQRVQYQYDALNRRIAKLIDTNDDGTPDEGSYFIYDGLRESRDNAGDHLALQLDLNGAVSHRYLHGPAVDQVLADEDDQGNVLWPLADNLGTIRDLASYDDSTSTTSIANHLVYGAFGEVVSETDAAIDHLFAFTGRERDDESDLQYHRARYYDAVLGQWMGEDPIGFEAGDANLRRYVGNRSTTRIDPSGLLDWDQLSSLESDLRDGRMNNRDAFNWLVAEFGHTEQSIRAARTRPLSLLESEVAGRLSSLDAERQYYNVRDWDQAAEYAKKLFADSQLPPGVLPELLRIYEKNGVNEIDAIGHVLDAFHWGFVVEVDDTWNPFGRYAIDETTGLGSSRRRIILDDDWVILPWVTGGRPASSYAKALYQALQDDLVAPPPTAGASSYGTLTETWSGGSIDQARIKAVASIYQLARDVRNEVAMEVAMAAGAPAAAAVLAEVIDKVYEARKAKRLAEGPAQVNSDAYRTGWENAFAPHTNTPYVAFNKTHVGSQPVPKGVGPNGGRLQSHHGLQQEWGTHNLPGYDPKLAPTVTIETGKGFPHTTLSNLQNARRDARVAAGLGKWTSTIDDELKYIVTDFRQAGFGNDVINQVLEQNYRMLDKRGVTYTKPAGF